MQSGDVYRYLFEHAPCGYLVLDAQGHITLANQTLLDWLGLGYNDVVGKRLLDLLPVAGRMFYETHFAPLLQMQGYFHEVALDFVKFDGSRLPTLANATQQSADGRPLETLIAIFQATTRRKYERELYEAHQASNKARKEVEALNLALTQTGKLRDEFIAVLGHDLRNPLAAIGSGVRILSKDVTDPKSSRILGLIEGSVARMSGLIGDVLDFTRGRLGGGLSVKRTWEAGLDLILEQVIAELESGSGRAIGRVISVDRPTYIDRGRLAQLVSNLLGNALTHGAAEHPVELAARMENGCLVIEIANGGDPIPSETIDRLFQPFFRGAAGRNDQGLGLGLHIASEIAKAHGGTLIVSSSSDRTVFRFEMPNTADEPDHFRA